jgi:peptidoglycan/LPS O-acetylase OafA/YrhL
MQEATEAGKTGTRTRIPELDGLRGVAILLVVLWHYVFVFARVPRGSLVAHAVSLLRLAWSGVDLFLVLSGFLIGGILIDSRRAPNYFTTFYIRRFFRIVPLYAVVCALYWACAILGAASWRGGAGRALFANPPPWYAFALFVQNIVMAKRGSFEPLALGITWSLAVEEQFYLTFPLVVRLLSPRRLIQLLVVILVTAPMLRTLTFYAIPHGDVAAYVLAPMRADSLAAGVLAAVAVRSAGAHAWLVRNRWSLRTSVVFLAAGALVAMLLGCTNNTSAVMGTVGYTWLACLYALVLLLVVSGPEGRLRTLLRTQWLRALGHMAFGTYLLHVAVLCVCFGVLLGREPRIADCSELGVTLLAAGVTVVIARVSWTQFEQRMLRVGRRYAYEPPPSAGGPSGERLRYAE